MTLYALFLCVQATGMCTMQGQARMTYAGPLPAQTYHTLVDCQRAGTVSSGRPPDDSGRFPIANGTLWYECRSKHVDQWESPAR